MAVSHRTAPRRTARGSSLRRIAQLARLQTSRRPTEARALPPASPGQIAVIYRWGAWLLALGLIVSGSTATFGRAWWLHGDVFLLLGLTLAVNVLLSLGLHPYMRLMRRYPGVLALDVFFCLGVYYHSDIWTSPFQFYSYAALMLPVTIFFFGGALAGSALFLVMNLVLLYTVGDSFAWAQAHGQADTYIMQLAIVPLLAFVFAYPNRLYAQLRRAQRRLDLAEREQLLAAERTRIAQSLHDSVAQLLFGIRLLAESSLARPASAPVASDDAAGEPGADRAALAGTLLQVHDLATRGNQEMRRAIYALDDLDVSRRGLPASLRALLADLGARSGVATHLTMDGDAGPDRSMQGEPAALSAIPRDPDGERELASGADRRPASMSSTSPAAPAPPDGVELPPAVAEALYKVAREALANVEKHAGALNVWLELSVAPALVVLDGRWARLVVRDDGCGFRRPWLAQPGEPDEDEPDQMHFGMSNMRRAVETVGGTIALETTPGRGTTIAARVPLP
jgi:signal transduction histidine kinase